MNSQTIAAGQGGPNYRYRPLIFFPVTLAGTWAMFFIAAWFAGTQPSSPWAVVFEYAAMFVPGLVALSLVTGSRNQGLKADFKRRLTDLRLIRPADGLLIVLLPPGTLAAATAISLLFGLPAGQFALSPGFSLTDGHAAPLLIGVLAAPVFEELGWRGYGVDSLYRDSRKLFTASLLYALFWAAWHAPLFFIQGFYWQWVLEQGFIFGLNIIVSVLAMAFINNWLYWRTRRSIPAIMLFHAMNNISLSLLQTELVTKCIVTLILLTVAVTVTLRSYPGLRECARPAVSQGNEGPLNDLAG
jgi:membrane protease YdiL (CAAX protease family)